MKKNIILVGVLALGTFTVVNAQIGRVGINTDTPQSTLDVRGKVDTDGKSLANDMTGLQAPRLTREELTNKGNALYGTDQKGALIYITDVSAGTATSQRINITTPGYYYFDGAEWQKFSDTDTSNSPTGFERRPDMTATNFYWRLIGADATKYGTEGKYGLDATWNPADFSETVDVGGGFVLSYNTIMGLAGLTTSNLGALGKNSFTAGAINSASGNLSTALGGANTTSGHVSFAAGGLNKSTGRYSASIGNSNISSGQASFAAGNTNEATGDQSVAIGNASKASGENSVAIGQANSASAQGTLALGNTNTASSVSAVGIGQHNTASGQGSLAIGNTNTTSNTSSVAIGQSNVVNAPAAVAIGNSNNLSTAADSSLALGFTNTVTGNSSFAIGNANTLSALRTFAIGSDNNVTGQYAKAIGYSLTAPSQFSTSLGLYNTDETLPQSAAYSDLTKRLLVVGNGASSSAKSDALVILRNGKTGISQSVPTETLDVGVGNVRVRDINSITGSLSTDKYVVADANGVLKTVPVPSPVNIYTADGSITGTASPGFFRTLTLNGSNLQFSGFQQRTLWSATGALSQSNTQSSGGLASFVMNGGGSTQLSIQQFNGAEAQIFASLGTTALNIGSNTSTASTPIKFITSSGSGALGTEKARITGDGKVGISTIAPSETLDVGTGNVRVRQINSNLSTDPTDKFVVADSNGVLKAANIFVPKTSLVGFRTTATANITANSTVNVLFTTNPLLSGFTYDYTTGVYTSGNAGYYQISVTVAKDISMNSPSGGTSGVRLLVNGSAVNAVSNGYLDGSQSTNQNMTYVVYLNADDNFNITTSYTRTSKITNAQVSVIALGG